MEGRGSRELPDFDEEKFTVKAKKKPDLELGIRICRQDDLEDILDLQRLVYDKVPDKDTFVLSTRDEIKESLAQDVCIGVFHFGTLIAFTLMVVNRISKRNLAFSLGFDEEICRSAVTFDTTFINPMYTGYGLQRFLSDMREQYAVRLGASAAYATVSPKNTVSLSNIMSRGFHIVAEKTMYGNYRRFILKKTF